MGSIEDLIDSFYEAADRPDVLPGALVAAHGFFRSTAGALYVQNPSQTEGRMMGAEAAAAAGFDDRRVREYWEHFYSRNPMLEVTDRLGTGRVATDADLALLPTAPRFDEGEFYEDWARPQGFRHVMGEFVDRRNDGALIMAVWRERTEGAYRADEIAAFGRLNRHVARAVDIGARLRAAEAEMETVLARMTAAVLTIGRDGRLRHANATADALLGAGTALRRVNGRLRTAFPDDQSALDRLVACALDPRLGTWAENAAVPLRRTDGRPPLVARAVAVARRFDPFAPDRAAAAILMVEGFEAEDADIGERLRRRFGLSPAQARVARQFHAGRSPAQAALALGLSVETVRTHLKVLFARTDTHRQPELVLRLKAETGG